MKTSAMSAKAQDEYDKRFGSLANHYVNGNRQTPQQLPPREFTRRAGEGKLICMPRVLLAAVAFAYCR